MRTGNEDNHEIRLTPWCGHCTSTLTAAFPSSLAARTLRSQVCTLFVPFFVQFNPYKGTCFVIFALLTGHGGPYPERPLASALSTRAHTTFAVPRASHCARQAPSPPTPLVVLRTVGIGRRLMTLSGESSVVRVLGVPER